ncbi:MAG: hypothetical protein ACM31C_16345, partial [Acidobacteriota bacterium]
KLLLAGEHQIVASKPGYTTETKSVVLVGGKEMAQVVALHPIAVKAKLVRRWNASVPWIVLGTGAATAAIGGALEWLSHRDYQSFDQAAATVCPCPPGKIDTSTRSRARVENVAGVSLLAVGGAVAAAGILGVYLNQPRAIAEHAPVITPSVGPAGAHVTATWTW